MGCKHSPEKHRGIILCAGLKHDTVVPYRVSVTRITVGYRFDMDHLDNTVHGGGHMWLRWQLGCYYIFLIPTVSYYRVVFELSKAGWFCLRTLQINSGKPGKNSV